MTSDGSNFYNIKSWVSSRNIAGRRYERDLGTKTLDLKLEAYDALFSLWKPQLGLAYNVL